MLPHLVTCQMRDFFIFIDVRKRVFAEIETASNITCEVTKK